VHVTQGAQAATGSPRPSTHHCASRLYKDEQGRGVFEYDRPLSLVGQFGDEQVTEVGRSLDRELEAALLATAR
jgi:hypothetical protein